MVESLDLFRMAKFFHTDMATVAERYTEAVLLDWGVPVLMLKTVSPDDACIFLRDNLCSIQSGAKPRACRLYPLSVGPDEKLKDFLIFNVSGKHQHHFTGRQYRAQDWVDAHFGSVDQAYIRTEYKAMRECGFILRQIPRERENDVMFQMLRWRYIEYDKNRTFMTQFKRNMEILKQELKRIKGGH